ncbi:MAG: redox-regulated ATPase YchF [Clostridiales bacterium]|nr:redox-regulated ATPase YchF [Clostridiales bacterium]
MKLGIVGLPNVGKSTLFNALTKAGAAEAANYPFCTIEPNVGIVPVPDKRLDFLTKMYDAKKTIHAVIEFVDIAGLVEGASKGEGLGNKFLEHIRQVDAICHVVRCFDDENVVHVDGRVSPSKDVEIVNLELIFSDIETLDKRMARTRKLVKTGDKIYPRMIDFYTRLKVHLEAGKPARLFDVASNEKDFYRDLFLLTSKPVLYMANTDEEAFINKNPHVVELETIAKAEQSEVVSICAKLEEEISTFDETDKHEFLTEIGVDKTGLEKFITKSYSLLNLISFLTAGPKEVKAWTITSGSTAPQAAGKIHSDFERGFIRAEVVAYKDLEEYKTIAAAREKGLVKSEGKEYIVKDGDVILFRFNV